MVHEPMAFGENLCGLFYWHAIRSRALGTCIQLWITKTHEAKGSTWEWGVRAYPKFWKKLACNNCLFTRKINSRFNAPQSLIQGPSKFGQQLVDPLVKASFSSPVSRVRVIALSRFGGARARRAWSLESWYSFGSKQHYLHGFKTMDWNDVDLLGSATTMIEFPDTFNSSGLALTDSTCLSIIPHKQRWSPTF